MFTENAENREGNRVPLHNERPHNPEEATSSGGPGVEGDGMWGERDVGGPVNLRTAMHDYEELRKELTTLSRTRSGKSARTTRSGARQSTVALQKVQSSASRRSQPTRASTRGDDIEAQEEEEKLPGPDDDAESEEEFELGGFLKDGHFEKRDESGSAKKVGVVYKHLTVQGVGATSTFVRTLPNAVIGVSCQLIDALQSMLTLCFTDFRTRSFQNCFSFYPRLGKVVLSGREEKSDP